MARLIIGWIVGLAVALVIGATLQPHGVVGFLVGFGIPLFGAWVAHESRPDPTP